MPGAGDHFYVMDDLDEAREAAESRQTRGRDAVLAGRAPSTEQARSIGCNIKWKPGNEPNYFTR